MARRKEFIKLKFFSFKIKINRKTTRNLFALFFLLGAALTGLSFLTRIGIVEEGRALQKINELLFFYFGALSFFVPLLLLLFSAHLLSSKKLKIVKLSYTLGLVLIFSSLLPLLRAGSVGNFIFENLAVNFSSLGATIVLLAFFFIGLSLFFGITLEEVLIYTVKFLKFVKGVWRKTVKLIKEGTKELKDKPKEKDLEFVEKPKVYEEPKPEVREEKKEANKSLSPSIKPIYTSDKSVWNYPPISLLEDLDQKEADRGDVNKNADIIEQTLDSFGIRAKVVDVNKGPSVTQYAIKITRGTKLSKVTSLANDLALALAAPTGQIRIEAPIPGTSYVGIEIPNRRPQIVTLKEMLISPLMKDNPDPLLVPLGLDVSGRPQVYSISRMPHVLIAGATGSGKSVLLNAWISTLLFRTRPDEVRLILVDPKRVELTLYNGVPHLLTEVVVEPERTVSALRWTVKEMEARYKLFSKHGVRNLDDYNKLEEVEKKPKIVFVIDELADLMLFAPADVEELITRLAQMARATGIHLVLATQRPSVDVITGLMKANIPTRIAFNVSSMIDSRVIIDMPGAEKLLGKGDMLFLPPDRAKPIRIQGPFVTTPEVKKLINFLKMQVPEAGTHYEEEIVQSTDYISTGRRGTSIDVEGKDVLFDKAVEIIMQYDKASASLLQRRLSIGYARAARILDQLEKAGYVGPAEGSKPREVIKRKIMEDKGM